MALNSSGPISLGGATAGQSINLELGQAATATTSLNATNVRTLAGVLSGQIIMPTNFWGKSSLTPFYAYTGSLGNLFDTLSTFGVPKPSVGLGMYVNISAGAVVAQSFITKIDADGDGVWQRQFTNASGSGAACICNDGTVYVSKLDTGAVTSAPVIYKYDTNGVLQWQYQYHQGVNAPYARIIADSSNNIYTISSVGTTTFILKINSAGAIVWQISLGVVSGTASIAQNLKLNSTGTTLYAAATSQSIASNYRVTFYTINTSTGAVTAQMTLGTTTSTQQIAIPFDVDSSGNWYIAMQSNFTTPNRSYQVSKWSSTGTLIWSDNVTMNTLQAQDMVVKPDGSAVYFIGGQEETVVAGRLLQNFIIKYNSSGVQQWQRGIVGTPGSFLQFNAATHQWAVLEGDALYYNVNIATFPDAFAPYGLPKYEGIPGYLTITDAQLSAATTTYAAYTGVLNIATYAFGVGSGSVTFTGETTAVGTPAFTATATANGESAVTWTWVKSLAT